jgi:hypothetical protein
MSEIVYICQIFREKVLYCSQHYFSFDEYKNCIKGSINHTCKRFDNYDDALTELKKEKNQDVITDIITIKKSINNHESVLGKNLELRKNYYERQI